ncbi:hypothetical protein LINPERHAP2_LOCUS9565 [Linum perenne]
MWGGLGFRDSNCFSQTMLAKIAWRALTNQSSLWVKYLKAHYFPHSDFLTSKKVSFASWIWSSI